MRGGAGPYQSVEKFPIAASLQKVQTLTYKKYASTLNFFLLLALGIFERTADNNFFNTQLSIKAQSAIRRAGTPE
ncbi:MAG: hypothetical protein EA399_11330 [Desulfovibrionales bacterium]|nr:MAG: hypothetical protein EA399_11330 [Desulfovibrionales bacterium]